MKLHVETSRGSQEITVHCNGNDAAGSLLTEVLRHHGLPLNTRCGQRGLCEGCRVELADGSTVQACTRTVRGGDADLFIRIPDRSLTAYEPQVVTDYRVHVPYGHLPLWSPRNAEARQPVAGGPPLGAAIDVGTTTVAVLVVDLATGRVLGRAAGFNRQMHLGDDVLTRINLCLSDASLVGRLQEAIVNETISPLLDEALRDAGESRDQLMCVACAGNTTMLHLLAGVDPSPMGLAPFTPAFVDHRVVSLGELDFRWPRQNHAAFGGHGGPSVHLLPGAAAYIGADLAAGVVATGMLYRDDICLLVDIGTNGEIILKHGDRLLGCATAAGPAFEGGGLTDGIRAGRGAISHVRFDTDPFAVHCSVIGDDTPIGLCGSAYIDLLAQGLRTGLLSTTGRLQPETVGDIEPHLAGPGDCHGRGVRLAWAKGHKAIVLCESDVARLLQAKAAIAAGILTLLDRQGLKPADVNTLFLAGGFGMHVDIGHALLCGLLPGFNPSQIQLVGNTSLAGAVMALLDRTLLDEFTAVGRRLDVVELNLDPGFEDRYIDNLSMPDPPDR
jgi:uncharacterized 2Fe-2S/4Fe-4S cluster protein (DUF4445 family)